MLNRHSVIAGRLVILIIIAVFMVAVPLAAQEREFANATSRSAALQQEIPLDRFENVALWQASISSDFGIAVHRRLKGGVSARRPDWQPIELPQNADDRIVGLLDASTDTGENVLGVRVDYLKRGFTSIFVEAVRPIPVTGNIKQLSVWVVGRNQNHEMSLIVRDIDGLTKEVPFDDKLNFQGWQQMTATIPDFEQDTTVDGIRYQRGVRKFDPARPQRTLEVLGLLIRPDFTQTYGSYYVYFDDMRALADLSEVFPADEFGDNPNDNW